MGWTSGSILANDVWAIVRSHIDPFSRKKVAQEFIDAFEENDCDTMDECTQLQTDVTAQDHEIEDDWNDWDDWNDDDDYDDDDDGWDWDYRDDDSYDDYN